MTRLSFGELAGEGLGGVAFVRNCLQPEFDPPPALSTYTRVTVRRGECAATLAEEAFAGLVISLIGQVVRAARLRGDEALECPEAKWR